VSQSKNDREAQVVYEAIRKGTSAHSSENKKYDILMAKKKRGGQ